MTKYIYAIGLKKSLILVLVLSFGLFACTKETISPTVTVRDMVDTTAMIKSLGVFKNGPYGQVTGEAKVNFNDGKYTLVLSNINVSNGPDLHVYLSKEVLPVSFIDLGRLKSTNGTQVYEIKGMPDFDAYKYALIHCQQYDHLFGSAELK